MANSPTRAVPAHYHVSARSHPRDPFYWDDADYWCFVAMLGQTCQHFGWRCHAFCLLPTQYLLLLETRLPNLTDGMRQLAGSYWQYLRARYGSPRVANRYHAHAFTPRAELLEKICAVLAAPLANGLTAYPEAWRWSSYSLMASRSPLAWFAGADVLPLLAPDTQAALRVLSERVYARGGGGIPPLARSVRQCLAAYAASSDRFRD
jgi:putative transposase